MCNLCFLLLHLVFVVKRRLTQQSRGLTIRVSKLSLTPGTEHGADYRQLEAKLEVLYPGRNLERVVMEWVVEATGHDLQKGCALAHEHVVDQAGTMTAHLQCKQDKIQAQTS